MFPSLTASKGIEGPLVIEAEFGGHAVHRMYVNGGSLMEVLYEHCFNQLRLEIKSQMVLTTTSLTGFSGETIWPLGQLRLLVTIGGAEHYTKAWMNFIIVRSPSPYNGIIGRPKIREIQAVPSTAHGMLKFLVNGGIVTICSTTLTPTECATIAETPKDSAKKAEARHENFKVSIHPDFPDQEITIEGTVSTKARTGLRTLLKGNLDIFAWQPPDMTKHDGSWRMCVDSTNLNKACPQDCYPFQKSIGRSNSFAATPLSVSWTPTKAIIKYRWQNKIRKRRLFTLVTGQIGQNLEIYMDDLVIKSHTETELLRDIEETFRTLRKINMKLNPKKCTFRAGKGMFLGYMINPEGIKPCPDKMEAVLQLLSPRTIKEKYIKKSDFHWTLEAEQAFKQLKQHLAKLPMLGHSPDTDLFHKPSIASSRAKLYPNGKASPGASLCSQKVTQILPGTSHYGVGLILTSLEGTEFTYALRFQFTASNNEAEYAALIAGLRIAAQMRAHNVHVFVEVLKEKSIQEREMATVVEEERPTWMTPPWLRCVGPLQADYVIREIHEGSCSTHVGTRSMVAKAMRSGYYWPTMHRDVREMIHKCKDCQIHGPVPRHPQQPLNPITAPWPFYKWGIDITGPFPKGPGMVKFLIVAMDYFTKWIEAKVVAMITGSQVKKFVWDNIVCRFGLPGEIVSDNSKKFSGDPFKDWCEKLNIIQRFTSVKHPQSIGLIERANRSLGEGIKAHLGEGKKNWLEELPHVLWAHRTIIKSSNEDNIFSLTYRTKAVIPAEIRMPTYRTTVVDVVHNDEELRLNLDLLEERHERAVIRKAKAKLKMTKYYNARVRGVTFRPGDFVYRSNDASHAVDGGETWSEVGRTL
nr:reverse transcriptase domain-containing protein [Tanacetum cinerariifolium]